MKQTSPCSRPLKIADKAILDFLPLQNKSMAKNCQKCLLEKKMNRVFMLLAAVIGLMVLNQSFATQKDENVIVQIGKYRLQVPYVAVMDQKIIKQDKSTDLNSYKMARLKDLDIVENITVGSEYKGLVKYYKDKGKELVFSPDKDGIQVAPHGVSEIVLLPKDVAKTGNDEPVAFMCGPKSDHSTKNLSIRFCYTTYLHPTGLWLSYNTNIGDHSYKYLIEYDQNQRKRLSKAILPN